MAAFVVRTAAPVAVRMPIHPAVAENTAPTRKLTPVNRPFRGRNKTRMTNMMLTNPASTLYSVRRNAIAPARISAAMRCIVSVPGSFLLMLRMRKRAKRAAATGAPHPNT